ncbi:SRPBCC family protein [Streptomyces chryseus]
MHRWENTVTIHAPVADVWRLTTDIENWPSLSPTIKQVKRLDCGLLRVGSTAQVRQPWQTPAIWTVTRLDVEREFTWQAKRPGMTVIGSHILEPQGGECINTLAIEVEGPASVVFGIAVGKFLRRALWLENCGFRAKAEGLP